MVGILDMICQPALSPVNLLTINGGLEIIQDDKELVVFHLVINTIEVGYGAKPVLLIVKVSLHLLLQLGKGIFAVRVLGDLQDAGKQSFMLRIDSSILLNKGKCRVQIIEYAHPGLTLVAKLSSHT